MDQDRWPEMWDGAVNAYRLRRVKNELIGLHALWKLPPPLNK